MTHMRRRLASRLDIGRLDMGPLDMGRLDIVRSHVVRSAAIRPAGLTALLAGIVILLSGCGSDPAPDPTGQPSASQVDQAQQDAALSYRAGESESVETVASEQPSSPASPSEQSATEQAASEQAASGQAGQRVEASSGSAAESQSEPEAMLANTIAEGHRAGLVADRHIVGDPQAQIVITEYSDFL